jgi:hypothetical protein
MSWLPIKVQKKLSKVQKYHDHLLVINKSKLDVKDMLNEER